MGITFGDSGQRISRGGSPGGREEQRERRKRPHGGMRGVEVWCPKGVESGWWGLGLGTERHSREFAELQREVFCFD